MLALQFSFEASDYSETLQTAAAFAVQEAEFTWIKKLRGFGLVILLLCNFMELRIPCPCVQRVQTHVVFQETYCEIAVTQIERTLTLKLFYVLHSKEYLIMVALIFSVGY